MKQLLLLLTFLTATATSRAESGLKGSIGSLAHPSDDRAMNDRFNELLAKLANDKSNTRVAELNLQLEERTKPIHLTAVDSSKPAGIVNLVQRARAGVLMVSSVYKCDRCDKWHLAGTASGFVLSEDGIIATNYHVVETDEDDSGVMGVMTHDGRCFPVIEVLAADEPSDLAILRVDAKGLTALPLSRGDQAGSPITVISHPDGRLFTVSQGIISRYFLNPVPPKHTGDRTTWMSITADFAKGSSGAPVLNRKGEVTGMVAMTSTIYYGKKKEQKSEINPVQMVVKTCVPVEAIRKLVKLKRVKLEL